MGSKRANMCAPAVTAPRLSLVVPDRFSVSNATSRYLICSPFLAAWLVSAGPAVHRTAHRFVWEHANQVGDQEDTCGAVHFVELPEAADQSQKRCPRCGAARDVQMGQRWECSVRRIFFQNAID